MNSYLRVAVTAILLAVSVGLLSAETGREAWLRYAPLTETERAKYVSLPAAAVAIGDSELVRTAQSELVRGMRGMMGRVLREEKHLPKESAFVLGTLSSIQTVVPGLHPSNSLNED